MKCETSDFDFTQQSLRLESIAWSQEEMGNLPTTPLPVAIWVPYGSALKSDMRAASAKIMELVSVGFVENQAAE